jgi:hypothetical protein
MCVLRSTTVNVTQYPKSTFFRSSKQKQKHDDGREAEREPGGVPRIRRGTRALLFARCDALSSLRRRQVVEHSLSYENEDEREEFDAQEVFGVWLRILVCCISIEFGTLLVAVAQS